MAASTQTHFRACNLCEAICGLEVEVRDNRVVSIRGDEHDPFSRGYICPKAMALGDIQDDPDRLRRPVRRTRGGDWIEISWSEALDETADRIRATRAQHGADALAIYLGNPNVHSLGAMLYGPPFLRSIRTRNRFSATSVDQLPHHVAARFMFGHQLLLPVPDVDRTDFLLMLGANPIASNGSLMTAPGIRRRLAALERRGGRLVVVDPRRSETAEVAQRHIYIRPGTDALLLMAMLQVILAEGLERPGRLETITTPLDEVRRLSQPFTPERVAVATGIAAVDIASLARDFAGATTAACYGRVGVSTQRFGGLCQWLINVLNIVTGNLDRPGGSMFTNPAVDAVARSGRGQLGRWHSRVRGLPEFGGELPAAALAEEILEPGDGQVRALLTIAGNPVLSTPNGGQLETALPQLDFMASIDFYLNETTRHADIILPPTAPLERDHYDVVFHLLAVENSAKFSPAALAPPADALHDWQIVAELHRRLGAGPIHQRALHAFSRWAGPRGLLDLGLRFGPHGAGLNPFRRGLSLRRLERSRHGVHLGALEPCLPARLRTSDRRIQLAPAELTADLPRLRASLEAPPLEPVAGDLLLIGRRHLRSNNSWMHNLPRLVRGRSRCTLLMHPEDAGARALRNGQSVALISRVGRVVAPLELSDRIMPGVVSLPHGWGHHRAGARLTTAAQHAGASANDVTDDLVVDALCGTAAVNGVPVRVEAA